MQRKSKIILITAVATIAALVPVFGPFTFYHAVVPFLGPVLPKHDGVPSYASATYNWKGAGLIWNWEQALPNGCAKWDATNGQIAYYGLTLISGANGCDSSGLILSYISYSDHIVIGKGRDRGGGKPCPFKVSDEQIALFNSLLQQAKRRATPEIEMRALHAIERRLENLNGKTLTTDHTGGCNDLSLADYSNS